MIELEHVNKRYKRHQAPALDDLSLTIDRGEFVFVVGSSGSGKSTFLRLIIREESPSSGQLAVAGFRLNRLPNKHVPRLRRQIGTVFQDFRLLPSKNVYENVAFALRVIGGTDRHIRHAVPEVLDLVGLAGKERRMPNELSGGEQQRVALARAVVNRPPLLLADEPTGNLDPATSLEIVSLLERIHSAGTTVVMATHDSSIVDALGKRVIELDRGVLIRDEERGRYVPRLASANQGDPSPVAQEAIAVLPGPTAALYAQESPHHLNADADTEFSDDTGSWSAWDRSTVGPVAVPPSSTWTYTPQRPEADGAPGQSEPAQATTLNADSDSAWDLPVAEQSSTSRPWGDQ